MFQTKKDPLSNDNLVEALIACGASIEYAYSVMQFRKQIENQGINTVRRWAMLIGQCAHESGGFVRFEENLNYSWQTLMKVWPSRFKTKGQAKKYHRQKEKIANFVYGGRMGNNAPGEGYLYRGRGPIQLTGKNNYIAAGTALGLELEEQPNVLINDAAIGLMAACWFLKTNKRNGKTALEWADEGATKVVTRIINGGQHGLPDRIAKTNRALGIMLEDSSIYKRPIVRFNDRGQSVREVQKYLRALGYLHKVDGHYGKRTLTAIKAFQAKEGLVQDGIVGGNTFGRMSLLVANQ
ncbi:endolysin [Vibrio phage vB_VmeM-Yong XC32]|nr:endolysin [Vibrio phage vB_VmeM-Yong XC31]QAX96610.1 endolysin [Vibrio phage vB_VmeM-Yong XC32]QAX96928.1 endolysin [Vibrio phage vB_VmeM-Yong MS31]QAX97233.1 endolysin [Vibrio phage vB_VmeM-Yong MS32]